MLKLTVMFGTQAEKSINAVEKGCRFTKLDLVFEMALWLPDSWEMLLCVELFLFFSLGADPEQES